ncbi:hypothetical protein N9K03_00270 [bacterium]|nr:hypothetical protein [bacterium]
MKIFLKILLPLLLLSCIDDESILLELNDKYDVYIYDSTKGKRSGNLGKWYSYIQSDSPCPTIYGGFPTNSISPASCFFWLTDNNVENLDYVRSKGPWWIDPNHKSGTNLNGYGYVNVIAFSQIPLRQNSSVNIKDSKVEFSAKLSENFQTIFAESRDGVRESHIYLWIESAPRKIENCIENPQIGENCTRQSDYILTEFPIDKYIYQNDNSSFSINLSDYNSLDWTCLGAGDNVKYDCMGIESALENVYTIGFLAAPVQSCKLDGNENKCDLNVNILDHYITGEFMFKDFKVKKKYGLSSFGSEINFQIPSTNIRPSDGWSTLEFSNPMNFENYSGIRLEISNSNYLRFGLTTNNKSEKFEDLDFEIYISPESDQCGRIYGVLNDKIINLSNYCLGDRIELFLENGNFVLNKNSELIYITNQNCIDCSLYAFKSNLGNVSKSQSIKFFN